MLKIKVILKNVGNQPNSCWSPVYSFFSLMEVIGDQQLFGYPHSSKKKSYFVFSTRKKLLKDWNNIRVSK